MSTLEAKDKLIIYMWWGFTILCVRLVSNKKLFKFIFDRMIIKEPQ